MKILDMVTDGNNIQRMKLEFGKVSLELKDLTFSDLSKVEEFMAFLEKHICHFGEDKGFSWQAEELKKFLKDSTENQENMVKEIFNNPKGIKTKDLAKKIGLDGSQAIAALNAGFTKRIKRDFPGKEDFIGGDWSDKDWCNTFYIKEPYRKIIEDYFKNTTEVKK